MANTLLEQTRQLHEDMERAERLVVQDLKRTMSRYKEKLQQDHRTKRFVDSIQDNARKLISIYDDDEGVRRAEVERLGGQNAFSTFYERLRDVKEYYRKHATGELTVPPDDEATINTQVALEFTGEEMYGRYLDLHEFYHRFVNLGNGRAAASLASVRHANETEAAAEGGVAGDDAAQDTDYLYYVQTFVQFPRLPRALKMSRDYEAYLSDLLRYLVGFHERTQPLKPVTRLVEGVEDSFDGRWAAGEVHGWEDCGEGPSPPGPGEGGGEGAAGARDAVVDVDAFSSAEELMQLGAETLRAALAARKLKVGGTLQQRAARLYMCKGRDVSELPASVFAKGAAPAAALDDATRERRRALAARLAKLEAKILAVVDSLGGVVDDTRDWVEKKLAQNYDELKADIEAEDMDLGPADSDEEDEYVYNPLKLPLGPDGKPIPYWLYKLHGLNQEFRCEICGGDIFKGRREYERHFRDSKHTGAMAALGIPSSKAFFEVTRVEEALALWENLKHRGTGDWDAQAHEEFEDGEGNVYDRRTYLDLQRQGLV